MSKLYARLGCVGSSKSANLIGAALTYEKQGKTILVMKPLIDKRFGEFVVKSRNGTNVKANILIDENTDLLTVQYKGVSCIFVDEVQFCSPEIINQLRLITLMHEVPCICYGLLTDFKGELFIGTKRLLEQADSIEFIKSICHYCNKKAIFNMRLLNNTPTLQGDIIQLGDETYRATCFKHYYQLTQPKKYELDTMSQVVNENNLSIIEKPMAKNYFKNRLLLSDKEKVFFLLLLILCIFQIILFTQNIYNSINK